MAIAPSKLGSLISSVVGPRVDRSTAEALHKALEARDLVTPNTSVDGTHAAMARVRAEPNYTDPFNSPNERLREHLRPHLSSKGQAWAEPITLLDLPDEADAGERTGWLRRLRRRP